MTIKKHTPKLDLADAARCAAHFLTLIRCAGGRLVAVGFNCPHCDSYNPEEKCKEPIRPEMKY